MRLDLCAIGKARPGPERDLFERYCKRVVQLGRSIGVTDFKLHEIPENKAPRVPERRQRETERLLQAVPPGALCIALDERGRALTSTAFSDMMRATLDEGTPAMAFLIGGADGLDPGQTAGLQRIAFGSATWPHMLVRVLLAEQLYRAVTILAKHPYHREG